MSVWGDKIMDSDEAGDCAELLYSYAGIDSEDDDFDPAAPAVGAALTQHGAALLEHIAATFKIDSRITRDRAYLVLLVMLIRAGLPLPAQLLHQIAAEGSVFS
jgi:hypothetical protein